MPTIAPSQISPLLTPPDFSFLFDLAPFGQLIKTFPDEAIWFL